MTQTALTLDTIAAAERLLGVSYSLAERQQMLDNLEGQILSATQRRAVPLANNVPMIRACRALPCPMGPILCDCRP